LSPSVIIAQNGDGNAKRLPLREIRIAGHACALRAKERVDFDFSIASSSCSVVSQTLSLPAYAHS